MNDTGNVIYFHFRLTLETNEAEEQKHQHK